LSFTLFLIYNDNCEPDKKFIEISTLNSISFLMMILKKNQNSFMNTISKCFAGGSVCLTLLLQGNMICDAQQINGSGNKNESWPIITRKGDLLMEGPSVFRFFGLCAPNIQQNESQIRADRTNRFPDEFEIRDILDGLRRVGSRATRTFALSVYSPDDKGMPVYITGRLQYNEEAFRCLDRVIALCHEYDIRLIIPFIASQTFAGIRGVDEFSAIAEKPKGDFWTDPEQKEDFRHFLDFILSRKNTVNGILYKNDPAILAWQLGNEFGSYPGDRGFKYEEWSPKILDWSLEMAAYIKKTDPNHLVMEAGGADRTRLIADPNIDIISDHLYEYWNRMSGRPFQLAPLALESYNQCKGKKPLIIDEFGLGSTENICELMKTIRESNIAGGLMWSIRSHRRDGGWYYHNEGGTPVNSFHVPGFSAGFVYDEIKILDLLRKEAYLIRGIQAPEIDKPFPVPVLILRKDGFTWRGSSGAAFYTIERSENVTGPWKAIATGLDDSVLSDVVKFEQSPEASEPLTLYSDELALSGKVYYYRIKGENIAGASGYSEVIKVQK
jgi:mannan endo-1,4-beta-mannosidase